MSLNYLVRLRQWIAEIKRLFFRQVLQISILFVVSLIVLWQIVPSAFSADDTFDSFSPFQLKYSGKSVWTSIAEVTNTWKDTQGRFFPGSITLGTLSHNLLTERFEYKVFQLVLALVAIFLFYLLIRFLVRDHRIAALSCLMALCSMQFKVQYDPMLQFSSQQPFVMVILCSSFLAFVFACRREKLSLYFLSASFYLGALVTYESAVLLWPIFALILVAEQPSKWLRKLIGTTIAPSAVVIHLMYLRSQVATASDGYTSNFEFLPLTSTLMKQMVSSVPMSYAEIRTPSFLLGFPEYFASGNFFMWLSMLMSTGLAMWLGATVSIPNLRTRLSLIGIGITLWFMPALVVAQTVRWQNEIVLGNGYIAAYQGYFGFALVMLGIFLQLKAMLFGRRPIYTTVLTASLALVVGICLSSVVVNNSRAVAQYNPGYLWPREHFERAISSGVFSAAREDEVIFSSQREWWFNAPFIEWFGGPRLKEVVAPIDEALFGSCMMDVPTCADRLNLTYAFNTFGRSPNETRVTIVGRLQMLNSDSQGITAVLVNYPNFYVEYPNESVGLKESEDRCRSWLTQRLNLVGQNVSIDQVQVISATSKSCRASLNSPGELDLLRFTP